MNNDFPSPPSWDEYFLKGVYWVASKSKDPKTKIGAVIVKDKRIISTGYNGIPIGVNDKIASRHERPEKYKWYEHGERNAIYSAARHGINLDQSVLYTNALPCADCARGIVQAGIVAVYIHEQFNKLCIDQQREQWKGHDTVTYDLLREAGINVWSIDKNLGCKAYFNGKEYDI